MANQDGMTQDIRSREEEYFRRKDRELVEKMRQAAALNAGSPQNLETEWGIHDPSLLQELQALGFTPGTVSLLPLVPIVQVAWAEGGVTQAERTLIMQLARERGIAADSAADQQLTAWLEHCPSDDVFARAVRLIRAMSADPSAERSNVRVADVIHQCEQIAAASGGVMGFRKISAEERALLSQIEAALKSR